MDFQLMSPEEMQRAMQFLLSRQAASEATFDARMEQLSQKTDQVAQGPIGLTAIVGQVVDSVATIAEAQRRTDEQLRVSEERWRSADARLTEEIRATNSHLNAVIEMFDRRLRDDHGQQPS